MIDPYEFEDALDGAEAKSGWTADELTDEFDPPMGPIVMPRRVNALARPSGAPILAHSPAARLALADKLGPEWLAAAQAAVQPGFDPTDPAYEAISLGLGALVKIRQRERKPAGQYGMRLGRALSEPVKPRTYVVDQIIPAGGPALMVGRSGIGKSPLLFQLGMAVALGRPFLGLKTTQTPVLYIDAETSQEAALGYFRSISSFLGVPETEDPPFTFYSVNYDDWHTEGVHHETKTEELVKDLRPGLVIFDCLRPLWPDAERDNTNAQAFWRYQRHLSNTYGCATLTVHHLRKPVTDPKTGTTMGVRIQDDVREWLNQASGSSALITQAESRLAVDFYQNRDETRLVLGGFTKARESMSPLVIERQYDDDGEAIGYAINSQAEWETLPDDYKLVYAALPMHFRYADAQRQFPDKPKTTVGRILDKLKNIGKLKQGKDKIYVKL